MTINKKCKSAMTNKCTLSDLTQAQNWHDAGHGGPDLARGRPVWHHCLKRYIACHLYSIRKVVWFKQNIKIHAILLLGCEQIPLVLERDSLQNN